MTLPYPPELEIGTLHPPVAGPRSTVDVRRVVERLVRPSARGIEVAGRELSVPSGREAEAVLEAFRSAATERLLERRPLATADTVEGLEDVLEGELEQHERADDETLHVILETIDGL